MKIIKKVISLIAIITIAIGALALTGCGKKDNSNKSPLVGVWKGEEEYSDYGYKFNEDGTGSYLIINTEIPFTYQDKGDKIAFIFNDNQIENVVEYRFDGNALVIKELNGEIRYIKQ